jgi:chromosome segregation ATPase
MMISNLKTPETSECESPAVDSFSSEPHAMAYLRRQVQALENNFTAAEEHALSLERTAKALAAENRRLGHQMAHLTSENRRLRAAAEQMRAELLVYVKLLEPFPTTSQQTDRQRRDREQEPAGLNNESVAKRRNHEQELAGLRNQLVAAQARLESAYSSLCWRLTAPLRWCDDIRRHLVRWLRKGLGGDD